LLVMEHLVYEAETFIVSANTANGFEEFSCTIPHSGGNVTN